MKTLTKLEVGTKIIVKVSRNGVPANTILTITSIGVNYYVVKDIPKKDNRTYSVYFSGSPNDNFILATRKALTEYKRDEVSTLKEDLSEAQEELTVLEEFETEEDYVAHKLSMILQNKDDPKAIAKILKELKRTDYL